MSIVPRTVSASVADAKAQALNAIRTESGTGSASEFAGGEGLRVGRQNAVPEANGAIGAARPGRNSPPDSVAPSSTLCASAATASPSRLASGALSAELLEPDEAGAVLSVVQAATAPSAAAATPAASRRRRRRRRVSSIGHPPGRSGPGGDTCKEGGRPRGGNVKTPRSRPGSGRLFGARHH